jgi:hypothetical protein
VSAVAAVRARAVAVPAWLWLAGIVVVSAAIRIALGHRMVAPWIMIDEVVYSELAKSFAAHGQFLLRGVPSHGYGFVYPIVIAPAYRLFASVPDVYAAVKAINAIVMSLAAVPAYLLARRVLASGPALAVAALTVAVPSMLFTGTVMTENVFYPLLLLAALALMSALERPTPARQLLLLGACALAFLARQQAVALFAAAATAPILHTLIERRGWRGLRPWATLYAILAGGAVLAVLGTVARGRSLTTLLGAYRAATTEHYSASTIAHYLLWHVAELDLYLGVVPFAALLALWFAPRSVDAQARAFAAASLAIVPWLVLEVAAFASQQSERIEERNMFYVAPLALIPLLGLATDGVVTKRRSVLCAAAAVSAVLPVFVPYTRFITTSAVSDTFALLPWWWVQDHGVRLEAVRWAVLGAGLIAGSFFLLLRGRLALFLAVLVGAYFVATTFVVENGRHGIHQASLGSLWAGIHDPHPDWVDRAVGHDASVDFLWTGKLADPHALWENEFFNRSVRRVYAIDTPPVDPLGTSQATRRDDGDLVADGAPVRARYVLADGATDIRGREVARDPGIGLTLYRVDGPVVILSHVRGLYPGDTWSGKHATYTRVDCTGGRLSVTLASDPSLYRSDQVVSATVNGKPAGSVRIPPTGRRTLTVPLVPEPGTSRCVVHFTAAKTLVPARVVPGAKDPRPLGAHFLSFTPAT